MIRPLWVQLMGPFGTPRKDSRILGVHGPSGRLWFATPNDRTSPLSIISFAKSNHNFPDVVGRELLRGTCGSPRPMIERRRSLSEVSPDPIMTSRMSLGERHFREPDPGCAGPERRLPGLVLGRRYPYAGPGGTSFPLTDTLGQAVACRTALGSLEQCGAPKRA